MRRPYMLSLTTLLLLSSLTFAVAQETAPAPAGKTREELELISARIRNESAQAAYYEEQRIKLSEKPPPKSFLQSARENPAAVLGVLGATFAALVALVSFAFNYTAAIQNQRDTQFYEALKRFGDKDSPTLRASAVASLSQMAKLEVRRFRLQHPLASLRRERPYFVTARDQIVTALMLEDNRVALLILADAIKEVVGIDPGKPVQMLAAANGKLQYDMIIDLCDYLAASGIKGLDTMSQDDLKDLMAVGLLSGSALKAFSESMSYIIKPILNSRIAVVGTFTAEQKREHRAKAHAALAMTSFRLSLQTTAIAGILTAYPGRDTIPFDGHIFLTNVMLTGADLSKANLNESILTESELKGANLSQAVLTGAKLNRTLLDGTRLWKAVIDDYTDFSDANWWAANYYDDSGTAVDLGILRTLHARYGQSLPADLSGVHASVKQFLDSEPKANN
ncbi:MAG TPA: pentapeptide repeat-containing protein [Pyrinomonadaceae bacterium]|nr:pentapeptide repeat-containing protein [Pyrinomonadaceae bacterium]